MRTSEPPHLRDSNSCRVLAAVRSSWSAIERPDRLGSTLHLPARLRIGYGRAPTRPGMPDRDDAGSSPDRPNGRMATDASSDPDARSRRSAAAEGLSAIEDALLPGQNREP